MTAKEIKKAFKEQLPVIYNSTNARQIDCSHINAVIYRRNQNGRIMVSCELQDQTCPHSVIIARGREITLNNQNNMQKGETKTQ